MRQRQPRNPHGNIIANPLEKSKSGTSVPVIDLTGTDDEGQAPEVAPSSQHDNQSQVLRRVLAEHFRQTHHRYTNHQPYLHRYAQAYSQPHRPYHHHLRSPYQQAPLPLWGMPAAPPRPHRTNVPTHPPAQVHSPPLPAPPPPPSNRINSNVRRTATPWTDAEDTLLRGMLHRTPTPYHLIEPLLPLRTRSAIIQRVCLLRSEQRRRTQHWHHLREIGRQALRTRELATKPVHTLQPPDTIGETPQITNSYAENRTETEPETRAARDESSDEDGLLGERRLAELLGCESSDEENVKEERVKEDKLETEEVEFVFVAPKRDEYPYEKTESTARDDLQDPSERCIGDSQSRKRESDTLHDQDKKRFKKNERVVVRGV